MQNEGRDAKVPSFSLPIGHLQVSVRFQWFLAKAAFSASESEGDGVVLPKAHRSVGSPFLWCVAEPHSVWLSSGCGDTAVSVTELRPSWAGMQARAWEQNAPE